jgi:hypothetical protein
MVHSMAGASPEVVVDGDDVIERHRRSERDHQRAFPCRERDRSSEGDGKFAVPSNSGIEWKRPSSANRLDDECPAMRTHIRQRMDVVMRITCQK